MKEKDVLPILKNLGWRCGRDEAGDCFCQIEVGESQIQVTPYISKRTDHFRVSLAPSISTKSFTAAVAFILGEASDHDPIIVSNDEPERISAFSAEDVIRLSQQAILWAANQDIEKGLATYRALPTNSKGARPLRHLAALAIAGNVNQLSSYQRSFEQGDRLEFVPYITAEMVERALLLARKSEKTSS